MKLLYVAVSSLLLGAVSAQCPFARKVAAEEVDSAASKDTAIYSCVVESCGG